MAPLHVKDTAITKVDSLKAAIVTATMRPIMKEDTIEYNTKHIQIPPNTAVEDMLRRLPGIQIDASGNITYNGEKIQYLLVDGEDIFGSDPTLVTRNFDASKIAKVQVLDRKSDQAVFTGIDDGTRTKTLNLVMKQSAKDGYFGKIEIGGNADSYYNANGVLAAFSDKEQLTALGLASNTGVLGFSSNSGGTAANLNFIGRNTDVLGASAGAGIPRFEAAALHYANTWNGADDHVTANYQFGNLYTRPVTNMQSYQTQIDSVYGQNQQSQSVNQEIQHWVYGRFDWKPTSVSAFRVTLHGNSSQGQNQFGATDSSSFNDTLVNTSQHTIRDQFSKQNINSDIFWRKKIGDRTDHVFSVSSAVTNSASTTKGYLYSLNHFFQSNGILQSADTVNQRKQITDNSYGFSTSVNYTQPLWKGSTLGLSYGMTYSYDKSLQGTYDLGDGKYQNIVDSLSSSFKAMTLTQHVTLNFQGKIGRLKYTIGNDVLEYSYRQRDFIGDSNLHLVYRNIIPRLLLAYTTNPATSFSFNYNASMQQPTISQLAPVIDNSDPLHITLGNLDLKPGLNQNFWLELHRFRTYLINLTLDMSLAHNGISTKTVIDSLGRQVSQPVNVNGGKTIGLNFSINRKILGIDAGFHAYGSLSRTLNYVNANLSRNDAYVGGGGISLNKFVNDKYSLQLNTNVAYFDQTSSVNLAAPVRYWTQIHEGAITIYLIRSFELNTNATYSWQENTSAFAFSTSVLLWNGYVSRHFLHDKLVAKFQINNILNANEGITRTNSGNVNSQSSSKILGRYYMLSVIYHFDYKFRQK